MEQLKARLNESWAVGRAAYDAYRAHAGGVSLDGFETCVWEDLTTRVQDAWIAAGYAAAAERD